MPQIFGDIWRHARLPQLAREESLVSRDATELPTMLGALAHNKELFHLNDNSAKFQKL